MTGQMNTWLATAPGQPNLDTTGELEWANMNLWTTLEELEEPTGSQQGNMETINQCIIVNISTCVVTSTLCTKYSLNYLETCII